MRVRVALLFAVLAFARSASADDVDGQPSQEPAVVAQESAAPATPKAPEAVWELALDGSYLSSPIRGGTSPFGVGVGGHLGLSFLTGAKLDGSGQLYFGARVEYFVGERDIDVSNSSIIYGAEVGYAFRLARLRNLRFMLRPMVTAGALRISHTDPSTRTTTKVDVVTTASGRSSTTGGVSSDTVTLDNVFVEPRLVFLVQSGSGFVSLAGGAMIVPGVDYGAGLAMTWIPYGADLGFGLRL